MTADIGEQAQRRSFGRSVVRELFRWPLLVMVAVCTVLFVPGLAASYGRSGLAEGIAIVGGTWLLVAVMYAGGKTDWARRNRLRAARREVERAEGHRPFWASSAKIALILFPLAAVALLAGGEIFKHQASALSRLPPCEPGRTSRCVRTESGVLVSRSAPRGVQTIEVALPDGLRSIELSDDGWGGNWRGRFPAGERLRVQFHGSTPLAVYEPDGHRRKTDENPSDIGGALMFVGWVMLGLSLPVAFLFHRAQPWRTTAARLTLATRGRFF